MAVLTANEVVHALLERKNLRFWMWLLLLHLSLLPCCALLLFLSLYLFQSLGALVQSHPLSPHLPFRLQFSKVRPPRLSCAVLRLTQTRRLCLLRLVDYVAEPRVRCVAWELCYVALLFGSIAFPVVAAWWNLEIFYLRISAPGFEPRIPW